MIFNSFSIVSTTSGCSAIPFTFCNNISTFALCLSIWPVACDFKASINASLIVLTPLIVLHLIQILLILLLTFVFVVLLLFLCNQTLLSYYTAPSPIWFFVSFKTAFTFFWFDNFWFIFWCSNFFCHRVFLTKDSIPIFFILLICWSTNTIISSTLISSHFTSLLHLVYQFQASKNILCLPLLPLYQQKRQT